MTLPVRRKSSAGTLATEPFPLDVLETSPDAYFELDADWRLGYMNARADALLRILGLHRSTMAGESCWPQLEMLLGEAVRPKLESIAARGIGEEFDVASLRTGRHFTVLARPDGTRLHVHLHEITGQRNAEAALRGTHELLATIVAASPLPIVSLDTEGCVTLWNPAAERLFGWREAEVLDRPCPLVPEDGRAEFERFCELVLGGESFTDIEVRRQRRDGRILDISVSAAPRRDADGVIGGVTLVLTDCGARKRSEEGLRLLHSATTACSQADTVQDALASALLELCDFTGWAVGEAWHLIPGGRHLEREAIVVAVERQGSSCCGGFHDRQPTLAIGEGLPGRAALERRVVWVRDLANDPLFIRKEIATAAGLNAAVAIPIVHGPQLETVLVFFLPRVREEDEELVHVVSVVAGQLATMIQRLRTLRQLEESQKMEAVGRLAGGIAHDFNNLLTAILGHARLLKRRVAPADPLAVGIHEIDKAAERAAALTQQLLAFSRRQPRSPQPTDLGTTVGELASLLRRSIGEHIQLTVRSGALWPVLVDRNQIQQLLLNLAVNARDAMPSGGTLEVATYNLSVAPLQGTGDLAPGDYVVLEVRDSGTGMSPDVQARAFEPFFTTKPPDRGTGLGLAMVYGIVTQSGGSVRLESAEGVGTTIRVYLPRSQGPVLPDPVPRELPLVSGREVVLVVEDNALVRFVARETLEAAGYTVIEARDGAQGLAIAQATAEAIDLIVTDIVMPNLGGWDLLGELRALRPGLRVLLTSGFDDSADASPELLPPGTAFLRKPFTPEDLLGQVRALLDGIT